MKTKFFTLFVALLVTSLSYAQNLIKNDGATIHIQAGATLYVEGGIENTTLGTITNEGTIELKGDLLNNGTLDDTNGELIKFSGDQDATITTNGDFIKNLEIAKSDDKKVSLIDSLSVLSSLDFDHTTTGSRIELGAFNMTLQSGATLTDFGNDHFVVTNGAGALTRSGISGAGNVFPIGNTVGEYNPATLGINAGSGDYKARVYGTPTDGTGEGGTALTNVVDAGWNITDGGAGNSVDVTLQWAGSQELGTFNNTNAAIGKNDGAGWDLLASDLGGAAGADPYTMTRSGVSTFSNFAVGAKELANQLSLTLDLWLQGAYNGTDMDNDLVTLQLAAFAKTEPYTGYGYIQKAFGGGEMTTDPILTANNVVDWVLIELRDAGDNTLIKGTKAGLLLDNGMVANPDGTVPVTVDGLAPGNYFVVMKHKNSLSAMTSAPIDFTSGAAIVSFKGNSGILGGGLAQADLGSGAFGLWHSDFNGDGSVNGTDRILVWNDRNLSGYLRTDSNLSGSVNGTDRINAWNNRNKSTSVPIGN